ncbi:adult-specific cuticular protein ACP-20-like [Panulirus ornatus]|uniref:adult-specific cuticular protein ACP-20-like n=1 Tax=Panulirus ornatus TaxID=150431 RepID=UPI003A861834
MTTVKLTNFVCLLALVFSDASVTHAGHAHQGSLLSQGGSAHHGSYHSGSYHNAPPRYTYAYGVHDDHTGTNFGHNEARDGYNTEGKYYVHLPDGRIQVVSYYADEHGYHPHVSYEGVAHYPHVVSGHYGGYH